MPLPPLPNMILIYELKELLPIKNYLNNFVSRETHRVYSQPQPQPTWWATVP